ncbi:pilus assembly protein CpaE [Roseibium hamelinense]|uniref:Pilus assembly protein CpaE n=1 Tax=Roseibium hamelinense TaxID=150831 RepID=A0A562SJ52_9HYPH|nr:CpaE family protein [Roseibium hamelinense]MTI43915.1 CtpF protein [Roseibium hamelinense]TWI80790.1 pilus assembly protein CpaE [Roseibium hamelinense]
MANLDYSNLDAQASERFEDNGNQGINIPPVPRVSIQCFCAEQETARVVDAAAEDRRMAKAHVKTSMGGIEAAIQHFAQAPSPNLIVVQVSGGRDKILQDLENLAEHCDAGTSVIVIGSINDVTFYRELIHKGVSEYLVTPVDVYQFIGAVSDLFGDPDAGPLGRIIAFFGVKGGCGSSTVAHNVAWALAREFQNEVSVVDMDLAFGTAGLDFNQDPLQGIFEAISSPERLDETLLDRILSKCSEHLNLLAAPATLERTYDYSETSFDSLIDIMRGTTPNVVLDIPHAWNAWVKRTLVAADDVVMVAEPDLANLRNAKNLVDTLKQLRPNDRPPHLVINRSNVPKRPEIKPDEFAAALNLQILSVLPFEPQLFGTAANNGQMIGEVDENHASARLIKEIAHVVSGKAAPVKSKKNPLTALLTKLGKK